MEVLKEITVWDKLSFNPNHTYLVDDNDKIIAYKPKHGTEVRKSSVKLHRSRRKFEKFPYVAEDWPGVVIEQNTDVIEVQGSNGKVYKVNTVENTCTCPGFKFRGNCKHVV